MLAKGTYVLALTILRTKLDDILPTLEKQPNETRGQKKKTISQEEDTPNPKKQAKSLPYHEYLVVDFEQAQANAFIKFSYLHELINSEESKEAKNVFN
ncbi:hypothetical protein DSO57_1031578 [Entomophthora muscae]|uniref:Uncharacterized protein n=1 Tax=Entomophthora muscae TaxID=34485 RepID=A0ACC2S2Q5_9FUNG|nr:hypothetical protein DSO57_1031578 [Entomophthora muscae]